jgi:NTP pyrophosphatase (non-canonical NTP hydrolase)
MSRDDRQAKVYEWCLATFGRAEQELQERAIRLVEEAIELAQAEGILECTLRDLLEVVYLKPSGYAHQEAGGVGTTLLAYCQAAGISANRAEKEEWDRVRQLDPEYFRERQARKVAAGVAFKTSRPKV